MDDADFIVLVGVLRLVGRLPEPIVRSLATGVRNEIPLARHVTWAVRVANPDIFSPAGSVYEGASLAILGIVPGARVALIDLFRASATYAGVVSARRVSVMSIRAGGPPAAAGLDGAIDAVVHAVSGRTKSVDAKDREIRLLQQCLMELELEYFRVVAENEAFVHERQLDEEMYIVPYYKNQGRTARRAKEFEETERQAMEKARNFQLEFAARGFTSALNTSEKAVAAAAGITANQRPLSDYFAFKRADSTV